MSTTSLRESPVSAVLSGLIIGFMQIIFATSLASLIFTGGLGSFLPRAIGIAIVATAVASGTVALLSARGVQGRIQSAPNALFVAVAGGVLAAGGNPETVLVSIVVTTLLTSAVILIMTALNLGALVRFLPYPVVAGFLAGTGWLLITGAISTMLDAPSDANILMLLASPDQFILWIPGVLVAVALLIVPRFINHPLSLPITLGLIIAIFFIGLRVAGITLDEAAGIGLLLGDLGEIRWRLLSTDLLAQTNWQAILAQSGTIATVIAISVVHLLLNASGLESVLEEDVDLNKELRVSGLLNFIATLTGGFIGYQSLSLSALSTKLAGRTRLIGIIAAVVSIIALLIGGELLFFFPRPLLGGLLLFLGLELIEDWVISAWKRFALPEYAVILIILVTIATTDFLTGVGVGLVLMVIIFVVSYSQLSPVRSQLDATMIRSSVERPRRFRDTLDKLGKRVLIMEMQGFLFFGTAHSLYERIRGAYDDEPPRYLILDFSRVNGLDSSAAFSFSKVKRLADQFKTEVVFTAANENHLAFLQYSGFDPEKAHRFPDLDHGLEWAEDEILMGSDETRTYVAMDLQTQLAHEGLQPDMAGRIRNYMEIMRFEEGQVVFREGDPADEIYLIELGQVSVYLNADSPDRIRLRSLQTGTMIGEVGIFTRGKRSATVIADETTIVYRLTREGIDRMEEEEPLLAAEFNALVLRLVADRLARASRLIERVRA